MGLYRYNVTLVFPLWLAEPTDTELMDTDGGLEHQSLSQKVIQDYFATQ